MTITIDKAIETLELDKTCEFEGDEQILTDALQLGIEALKKIKVARHYNVPSSAVLLPGENND